MSDQKLSRQPGTISSPYPSSPQAAGMIVAFAGSTAPSGWAMCNGAEVSQTTYSQLFGRISTTWNLCTNPLTGAAYGAPAGGNFRLPDLRGTFLRGVGYFADNTKDAILAGFQADQMQGHRHGAYYTGILGDQYFGNGTQFTSGASDGSYFATTGLSATVNGYIATPITDGPSGTPRTGTESRPQNVGINYVIKLYDDAGPIIMSGSPFIGTEFQPVPQLITGNNVLVVNKFYTISDIANTTQTLPAATGSNNVITVENTGTALVTVDGNGSETINGIANQIIGQYASLKLRDYAAGKWIVMH